MKKNYYAVAVGRKPGIYNNWDEKDGAENQVKGYPNARHKGFSTRLDAERWLKKEIRNAALDSLVR